MNLSIGRKQSYRCTNELIYKTEIELQMQKTNIWLPRGKRGERDKLGDWD